MTEVRGQEKESEVRSQETEEIGIRWLLTSGIRLPALKKTPSSDPASARILSSAVPACQVNSKL